MFIFRVWCIGMDAKHSIEPIGHPIGGTGLWDKARPGHSWTRLLPWLRPVCGLPSSLECHRWPSCCSCSQIRRQHIEGKFWLHFYLVISMQKPWTLILLGIRLLLGHHHYLHRLCLCLWVPGKPFIRTLMPSKKLWMNLLIICFPFPAVYSILLRSCIGHRVSIPLRVQADRAQTKQ